MVAIILLCGLPASGKTYLSYLLEQALGDRSLFIRFDDLFSLTEQIAATKSVHGLKGIRETILEGVVGILDNQSNYMSRRILQGHCRNYFDNIFIEDNFYMKSMRHKWFQVAKHRNLSFCTIYLTTPIAVCLERNKVRPTPLPEELIIKQHRKMELPNTNSYWERFSIVTDNLECQDVVHFLKVVNEHPFEDVNSDSTVKCDNSTKSFRHRVDLAYRKAVATQMRQACSQDKPGLFRKMHSLKSKIVNCKDTLQASESDDLDLVVSAKLNEMLESAANI